MARVAKPMSQPRTLEEIGLEQAYLTGTSNLLEDFYIPCLAVSRRYDRAVGYFRSSLFIVAGLAFSDFAMRGGTARIICSHQVDPKDAEAIARGTSWREITDLRSTEEVDRILADSAGSPVVQLLATLVGTRNLEIRVAVRPSQPGIFHDKIGIFCDDAGNTVSFSGSINETFSAWDPRINHEGFEVFCSWTGGSDAVRVARHIRYFENLWTGTHPGISTFELPDAARQHLLEYQDIEGLESAVLRVRRHFGSSESGVKSPSGQASGQRRELQDHQKAVVANWIANGYRGIIAHVTGAGKTISALEIVRQWTLPGRPALILVPSELLLEQWEREIKTEFEDQIELLIAGGGHGRNVWEPSLPDFTRGMTALGPRIVLSTVQTASQAAFLNKVQSGNHLLVVADEVHRVGAGGYRAVLGINAGGRLGLSATPERYGDPEGTRAIFDYFGEELKPAIGIADAIRLKRLVPYDYYVHRVGLSENEMERWNDLTKEIRQLYAAMPRTPDGAVIHTARYRLLLIQRARIVKQAESKAALAASVLKDEFRKGDRWLIYCDDQKQLRKVVTNLRRIGLEAFEYHSAMLGSRDATMSAFEVHGGILVAIKCLDEGIDIPLVNKALILASSTNPREFIQRRGRVLRAAPNKFSATIHDALVLPDKNSKDLAGDVPSFARTDLARAAQFATSARNTAVAVQIQMWCAEFGITNDDAIAGSFEDEEIPDA